MILNYLVSLSASYFTFLVSGILINRFDTADYNFFEIIACEILFTFFLVSTILLFAVEQQKQEEITSMVS